ncbi:ABC-type multidrug transport system permease subunit [Cerasibacillus quisquiliarum]|uniref:YesK-like protein n=1 Tax=Cerasibacillus quisquiliarum TaxID=227865 RepID=A0A511V0U4_9BACI|nr:hypothetical protein [Cerasibacillus quisquiliarum]MBB5147598.1 ABC-type multidrug transport system permease subunit [Cerasibacillus quisquiliarum]GEN32526.1 hypothetical protein CQU01_27640 [Cerasibacillus quisquiliarum]
MDFLIPVFLGITINLIIFTIAIFTVKDRKACNITLFLTTASTLFISLLIGGFTGIGILVIALGMLIVAITFSLINLILKKKTLNQKIS